MAATIEQRTVQVSVELYCRFPTCEGFAAPLLKQMSGGCYDWPMSVLTLDRSHHDLYLVGVPTAAKRTNRAKLRGYGFAHFDRLDYIDDIHAINTSLETRQGRPMSDSYRNRPTFSDLGDQPCSRHRVNCYGVFDKYDTLIAYTFIYRAGQLALVSQVLGHGDHLKQEVMFLLMTETVRAEIPEGGYLTYNRHDSGNTGLVWHKERLGFRPTRIEWTQ